MYPVNSQLIESDVLKEKGITLTVLRFDEIHPVISGNKLFKLHFFLEEIKQLGIGHVVSFGGAYSNHLVAAAYSCKMNNLQCTGIVRGEPPSMLSHTLQQCEEYGMQLTFVTRQQYQHKEEPDFINTTVGINEDFYCIPEGGYHPLGSRGSSLMMNYVNGHATHIACAVGTATTVAGLLSAAADYQQVIAIPVLKDLSDLHQRLNFLNGEKYTERQLHIAQGFHFGGYAKSNQQLFDFMNQLFHDYQLPTDFVYTAKMMYGILNMIQHNFFKRGSNIVCMHTGGLQGNLSLQKNILTFA